MNSLNGLSEDEFVSLLTSNMEEISKTSEYQTAIRAMNIAFLNEILLCSKANPDNIYSLPNSQINKLQKEVLNGNKQIALKDEFGREFQVNLEGQPDYEDTEATYRNLASSLEYEKTISLIQIISKYTPGIPKDRLCRLINLSYSWRNRVYIKFKKKLLDN